jgi:hypothetical protein
MESATSPMNADLVEKASLYQQCVRGHSALEGMAVSGPGQQLQDPAGLITRHEDLLRAKIVRGGGN